MRRVFAAGPFVQGERIALDDAALAHLRVLRLKAGAPVALFDGRGQLAVATLEGADRALAARIDGVERAPPPRPVVLVQALAKGDKLDDVIRMATEIGVQAIELVETTYAVARPDARRRQRWERIAREATRQSEQAWTPDIRGPGELLAVARSAPEQARRIVLSPRGSHQPPPPSGASTWLVVGPEGGLSADEDEALRAMGYVPWTLPTGILRTETAAAVALGALL